MSNIPIESLENINNSCRNMLDNLGDVRPYSVDHEDVENFCLDLEDDVKSIEHHISVIRQMNDKYNK
ncbi:hypothetical protein LCGC14_0614490 [marine sediment metagenome]|uniref:Uncharacterized protein n=1 Tax=marine sediment metagenome TaxID=412755 RepID=A0A0F9RBG0_9ZZZZ